MSYIYDLVDTWNDGATTFTAVKMNVTDTASAAGSLLLELQTNTGGAPTTRFSVSKTGSGVFGLNVSANNFITNLLGGRFFARSDSGGFVLGAADDVIIGRRAAANLRLGAADAAAPVAQTLSVQSVVAGTSNTAGTNLTINGSQGTGTGAGGSIIFQVAPAGSSGTAQNALATALTINSAQQLLASDGTAALPSISFSSQPGNGFAHLNANEFGVSVNGVRQFVFSGENFLIRANSGLLRFGLSGDVNIGRDDAQVLAQRNGLNAQESRIYGSFTSTTNFQRLSIKTLRESSGALSGASYTTTIAIPAYANLIGVTTRVTTAVTGATSYSVGDGSDVDLWGATIGVTLGSQSRTADFTAVGAVGAAATSRTVTLTANGSNFTGGVVEICLHYLTTEAD